MFSFQVRPLSEAVVEPNCTCAVESIKSHVMMEEARLCRRLACRLLALKRGLLVRVNTVNGNTSQECDTRLDIIDHWGNSQSALSMLIKNG